MALKEESVVPIDSEVFCEPQFLSTHTAYDSGFQSLIEFTDETPPSSENTVPLPMLMSLWNLIFSERIGNGYSTKCNLCGMKFQGCPIYHVAQNHMTWSVNQETQCNPSSFNANFEITRTQTQIENVADLESPVFVQFENEPPKNIEITKSNYFTEEVSEDQKERNTKLIEKLDEFIHETNIPKTEPCEKAALGSQLWPFDANFMCSACGLLLDSALSLSKHEKSCLKHLVCKTCGKGFRSKSDLDRHERSHSGEKPFKCSFCPSEFSQRSHLEKHKKIHLKSEPEALNCKENKKSWTCDVCYKKFVSKFQLNRHKMSHSKEKPYECSKCDLRFSCKEYLKRHERIHTRTEPFKCEICSASFRVKSALVVHRNTHLQPSWLNEECKTPDISKCVDIMEFRVQDQEDFLKSLQFSDVSQN